MHRLLVLTLLPLLLAGCTSWPLHRRPALISNGEAHAEIVIAASPTRMQKLAAEELQTYLAKISGATLPIVHTASAGTLQIYVGRSPATDKLGISAKGLKDGAFRQISGPDYLVLLGDDTDFIPGDYDAREVNDRARIRPAIDDQTAPDLWVDSFGPYMDRNLQAETGWWKDDHRGSLNAVYAFLRSLGVRWYMPGELGEIVPTEKTIPLPTIKQTVKPDFQLRHHDFNRYDRISRQEILWHYRLGLNHGCEFYGNGGRHGTNFVHGRDETKTAHPEYFATWNDEIQTSYSTYGAPCLSSEALIKATIRYCNDIFELYDTPAIDIGIADNLGKSGQVCQCEKCRAQYTPDRPSGKLSDYAWRYYDRVAREVYKTHPDKYIVAVAYQQALQPPLTIEKLSPNLIVGIATPYRTKMHHPDLLNEAQLEMPSIRHAWLQKVTSGKMFNWEYYLTSRPQKGEYSGVPAYYLKSIVEDLRNLKAMPAMRGEHVEVIRNLPKQKIPVDAPPWGDTWGELYAPGYSHLNVWLTARLYWDVNQDAGAMLDEYFTNFYGPAADPMRQFVDYCEAHWPEMGEAKPSGEAIETALDLINSARQVAGDTIYGRRIQMIADFMRPLENRRPQKRTNNAHLVAAPRPIKDLTLDGRLDDVFWAELPTYALSPVQGAGSPKAGTTFRIAWGDEALCLAIHCQDPDSIRAMGSDHDDKAIFAGDTVEIVIETQTHSHYQIVINPAGLVADLDRQDQLDWEWDSLAKVASQQTPTSWDLEVVIPMDDSGEVDANTLTGVSGRRPNADSPWYINICRSRPRQDATEITAFSPTGDKGFHASYTFAKLTLPPP